MRKILNYLKLFIQEDFSLVRYGLSVFVLVLLFLAYYHPANNILVSELGLFLGVNGTFDYLLLSALAVLIFYTISYPRHSLKSILFLLFVILTLTFNDYGKQLSVNIFYYLELDTKLFDWFYKCYINFQKIICLSAPLVLSYYLQKKSGKLDSFYGLQKKGFDYKPYLIMLCLMIPLIFFASLSDSFQSKYPRYIPGKAEEAGLISEWVSVTIFEATYLLRFIGVELFFRGFLIIGGVLVFGRKAILPAACLYSAWHFGKPMGEAIGAFFGGYILGVIAYRTKSIYGGIAIHYGIALLMELFAWLAILLL